MSVSYKKSGQHLCRDVGGKMMRKSNSGGNGSVDFSYRPRSMKRRLWAGEKYMYDMNTPMKRGIERRAHSESVAVVPVLIDCQGDWVSRIYLAYARTTPRNDARAYCSTRARASEIIRAVYMITPYRAKISLSMACQIFFPLCPLRPAGTDICIATATLMTMLDRKACNTRYTKQNIFFALYIYLSLVTYALPVYVEIIRSHDEQSSTLRANRSRIYATSRNQVLMSCAAQRKL